MCTLHSHSNLPQQSAAGRWRFSIRHDSARLPRGHGDLSTNTLCTKRTIQGALAFQVSPPSGESNVSPSVFTPASGAMSPSVATSMPGCVCTARRDTPPNPRRGFNCHDPVTLCFWTVACSTRALQYVLVRSICRARGQGQGCGNHKSLLPDGTI
jgi:hypothetical protein